MFHFEWKSLLLHTINTGQIRASVCILSRTAVWSLSECSSQNSVTIYKSMWLHITEELNFENRTCSRRRINISPRSTMKEKSHRRTDTEINVTQNVVWSPIGFRHRHWVWRYVSMKRLHTPYTRLILWFSNAVPSMSPVSERKNDFVKLNKETELLNNLGNITHSYTSDMPILFILFYCSWILSTEGMLKGKEKGGEEQDRREQLSDVLTKKRNTGN
jgi:hypothetical protein